MLEKLAASVTSMFSTNCCTWDTCPHAKLSSAVEILIDLVVLKDLVVEILIDLVVTNTNGFSGRNTDIFSAIKY